MHLIAAAVAALAVAPGQQATIDVSVATLWKAPNIYRAIDRPSVTNPVDPVQWSKNLSTTASRVWLDSHVQTQALYGQTVRVLEVRGSWAAVAVRRRARSAEPARLSGLARRSRSSQAGFDQAAGSGRPRAHGGCTWQRPRAHAQLRDAAAVARVRSAAGRPHARRHGLDRSRGARAPAAFSAASVIAQAKRFLGVHYLWGGLSAWGYDCSGLIWAVYREHGRTIPRDADPQFHHGTPVARSALRPGDLLFFGSPGYAEHDAIYVGNDRMLEAPDSAHRVRIVAGALDVLHRRAPLRVAANFEVRDGDASSRDDDEACEAGDADLSVGRMTTAPVGEGERRENAADQAADMPADRDVPGIANESTRLITIQRHRVALRGGRSSATR